MGTRITMTGLEREPSAHPVPQVAFRRPRVAPGEFTIGAVLWAGLAFYSISQGFADDRAPLVILGATGVAAMIVGVVWPIVVLRRVRVVVHGPVDATTGGLIRFTVSLVGHGSNLAVRWLDPVGDWLHAEAPSVGEVPVIATRRGVVDRVRVEVKCTGPMNIFVRHRQASMKLASPLYIAPRVIPYEVLDDVESGDDIPSSVPSAQTTESVRSTRPYVAGDSPRLVHWASTARTGEIVVREFDPAARAGIAIVVDLRGGSDVDVEAAAGRASGAARALLLRGVACMLVTCGTDPIVTRDTRTIDRVLASARVGVPSPVPPGWNATGNSAMTASKPSTASTAASATRSTQFQRAPGPHAVSLIGPWGFVAVALAVAMGAAISVGTDQAGLARPIGFLSGALVAVLAVGALPSFSKRIVVAVVLALGGLVLTRHVQIGNVDTTLVLLYVGGAVVAIVLCERVHAVTSMRLAPAHAPWQSTARHLVILATLMLSIGLVAAPFVGAAMHRDVRSGNDPDPFSEASGGGTMSIARSMDTRGRPRLTDRVVMTVDAQRPAFWRGATFDRWDGAVWKGTAFEQPAKPLSSSPDGWALVSPAPEDPAVDKGVANRQTFTIAAPYAEVLFAAPSAQRVLFDRIIGQRADGSLLSSSPLGKGTTYTVESNMANSTSESLQMVTNVIVPEIVTRNNLDPGRISDRVRALAASITHNSATPYEKVQAITAWLGANTSYSLDAPLPPSDSEDTVDFYLFESRQAWCEQISSALTVMLRSQSVPARIATGFTTGTRDRVTGRYTVKEKDAHAWTEVYFEGIGWQGFDPTAAVPLGGESAKTKTISEWLSDHAVTVAIGVVAAVVVWFSGVWLARTAQRRAQRRREPWAAATLRALESVGAAHDRVRRADETPGHYARELARLLGNPDLATVGIDIDAAAFGASSTPDEETRLRCSETLAAAR